jgi:serine/threonine-protein kinase
MGEAAPIQEGEILAGKYRIERELGAGGMGIVVAARHVELDQLVAIKFVREEALADQEAVSRFMREARAAVKLKSEHAAKVLDVGKLESGAPYMVMEYLEGLDLARVLELEGAQPVERAVEWVLQACEAVAEAHAAGIVHRDLKPQNLFVAKSVGGLARIKVLDFGVSKSMNPLSQGEGSLTRTHTMLGSPLYMSPEQMRSSRTVDARSDIWALGVVLFEILTKRWPFEAETIPELCLKVVSDPPVSLASIRPEVNRDIVAVVERCLAKNPADRYANAAELASALEPFVAPHSRVLAHRARLAMATSPARSVPAELASSPTIAADADARSAPTPAAWGSEGRPAVAGAPPRPRRGAAPLVVAGVAVLAVGGALALLASRSRPPKVVDTQVDPTPHTPVSAAVSPPSASTALPAPAPSAAAQLPPTVESAATPESAPTKPARTTPPPRPSAQRGTTPRLQAKPGADDDIPSLR